MNVSSYRLIFKKIEGENVLSYPSFSVDLDNHGLVLLKGPNGAGKSTIPTAIDYAIHSKTTRGIQYKELINLKEGKNFWLKLTILLDGVEYVIEHHRSHDEEKDGVKFFRAGEWITKHMGIKEVREYIPPALGLDRTNFLSTVYLSQEHHHVLVSGTPKEKEKYIMWLFGLNRYDELVAGAATKRNALTNSFENDERIHEELKDIEKHVKALPTRTQLDQRKIEHRETVKDLKAEISVLESRQTRLLDLRSKLKIRDDLTSQLRDLGVDDAPTATDIQDLQTKIDDLSEESGDLKTRTKLARKAQNLKDELADYQEGGNPEEILKKIEKAQSKKTLLINVTLRDSEKAKKLRMRRMKIKKLEYNIEYYESRIIELDTEISKIQRNVNTYHSKLKKGICPTCKRAWELTEEEIKELKVKLERARSSLDMKNKERQITKARLQSAEELETLKNKLTGLPEEDPQEIELRIRKIVRELKELSADLSIAERCKELRRIIEEAPKETVEELEHRENILRSQLKKAREHFKRISQAKTLLDQITKLPSGDLGETRKKFKETKLALEEARVSLERNRRILIKVKEQSRELRRLSRERNDLRESARTSRKARRDAHLWSTISQGLTTLLRQRERSLLKRLTRKIPAYMKPMFGKDTGWLKAELCKENNGIDLKLLTKGKPIPQKGISPGQRAKLGLASVFALRDLYDTGCNLLVLDEPLAGVDGLGLEGFADIVKELRNKINTLILISHDPAIKGLNFDEIWEASITDGQSTITTT